MLDEGKIQNFPEVNQGIINEESMNEEPGPVPKLLKQKSSFQPYKVEDEELLKYIGINKQPDISLEPLLKKNSENV